MAQVTVKLKEMSVEEAQAWVEAIAVKFGTQTVFECLKMMEHRFETMDVDTSKCEREY